MKGGVRDLEIPTTHCQGNLSFATNNTETQALMNEWSEAGYYAPRAIEDIKEESFLDVLRAAHRVADLSLAVRTASVTEHDQEMQEGRRPLDTPEEGEEDVRVTKTVENADAYESEILEELPLPGMPIGEADRKRKW